MNSPCSLPVSAYVGSAHLRASPYA
jgi:hypothetical protein